MTQASFTSQAKNSPKLQHKHIESKWQKKWDAEKIYSCEEMSAVAQKYYSLMMFPYPSAEGLHAGNMYAFTGSDIMSRFKRMQGYNVFEPIGLDGFGIHAENYALKVGRSPMDNAVITQTNYYKQLHMIGNAFDWARTVETYHPDYYKWTQWLFIQLFKAGLAYRASHPVNWCPDCMTVLADEQIQTPVQAGKIPPGYASLADIPEGVKVCERCGNIPELKNLEQWFFRITAYAQRLLDDQKKINWSERVAVAQRNWIGKKEGIDITYKIKGLSESITCFTTTPVNFGATFLALAPDHPFIKKVIQKEIEVDSKIYLEVERYIAENANTNKANEKEKTGVFSGFFVTNHLTTEDIPVWISDFVLNEVGTGAVQGCPAHDLRDFEFAKKFDIPIKRVVTGEDGDTSEVDTPEKIIEKGTKGTMINSGFLNGIDFADAIPKTMDYFEEKGWGKRVTSFHLRDWIISRQRYWGPPIPMVHCSECERNGKSWFDIKENGGKLLYKDQSNWNPAGWYPVSDEELPVVLPVIADYKPNGEGQSPLASHPEFYEAVCPQCGSPARRETDVSDTFLDSSWYFLRYPSVGSVTSETKPFDPEITKTWLPIDLYFGGAEHAVLHLMYARFVTKVLYDLKFLTFDEPFPKFFAHGLMIKDGAKMSKSKGNVVNPDVYIEKFGADTLRLYLMFMGPMDGNPDFRDTGIEGMHRFVEKIWKLFHEFRSLQLNEKDKQEIEVKKHKTIKRVSEEIENFRYNTAIAAVMEYANLLRVVGQRTTEQKNNAGTNTWNEALKVLVQMLAPFAPHMTEELWVENLDQTFSVHTSIWPAFDPSLIEEEEVTIVVQVNGKLRASITVQKDEASDKEKVLALARENEAIQKWLQAQKIKKEVFVPKKLVNFVI